MKIACVGAGPGGLYFALLMKQRHPTYEITVFERNRAETIYGLGLVFWDDLVEQLYLSDRPSAQEIELATFDWSGQVVDIAGKRMVDTETGGHSIHRQHLLNILSRRAQDLGVTIVYSHEVADRSELGDADLIVASDGVNSRIRVSNAARFGTSIEEGRNKYIWLATTQVVDSFEFDFVRTDCGWIWSAAYATDNQTSTFVVECAPETWRRLNYDTLSAAECLASLERVFARYLDSHRLISRTPCNETIPWFNFRRVTNQHWHDGNVVLLGDTAHTTHFSIGSGTRLALEDSITLADSLDRHRDLALALESYELERKSQLLLPQIEARYSARWLEGIARYVELSPEKFFALWQLRRSPLLAHMDPTAYYWLHEATSKVPILTHARDRIGLRARSLRRQGKGAIESRTGERGVLLTPHGPKAGPMDERNSVLDPAPSKRT